MLGHLRGSNEAGAGGRGRALEGHGQCHLLSLERFEAKSDLIAEERPFASRGFG